MELPKVLVVGGDLNVQTCNAMELPSSSSAYENCFRACMAYPAFWRVQIGYVTINGERIEHAWLISPSQRVHDPTLLYSIDDVDRYELLLEFRSDQLVDMAAPLWPLIFALED